MRSQVEQGPIRQLAWLLIFTLTMKRYPPYRRTCLLQRWVSIPLMLAYLLMLLSPTLSLAISGAQRMFPGTASCSGRCKQDGCSLASRLTHSCCCWKKNTAAGPAEAATTGALHQHCSASGESAVHTCCLPRVKPEIVQEVMEVILSAPDTPSSPAEQPSRDGTVITACGCASSPEDATVPGSSNLSDALPCSAHAVLQPVFLRGCFISSNQQAVSRHVRPAVPPPEIHAIPRA